MYNELYEVWRKEIENFELLSLPDDFYPRIADYLRRIKKESCMIDKKTVKASLLKKEMQNVKRMVHGLVKTRYKKLVKKAANGEKIPLDALTIEEKEIYTGIAPFAEAYQNLVRNLLQGQPPKTGVKQEHKNIVLRFLREVPAIIGSNLKTYGPFKAEDVASLPAKNAKMLIKQGLAEEVEVAP